DIRQGAQGNNGQWALPQGRAKRSIRRGSRRQATVAQRGGRASVDRTRLRSAVSEHRDEVTRRLIRHIQVRISKYCRYPVDMHAWPSKEQQRQAVVDVDIPFDSAGGVGIDPQTLRRQLEEFPSPERKRRDGNLARAPLPDRDCKCCKKKGCKDEDGKPDSTQGHGRIGTSLGKPHQSLGRQPLYGQTLVGAPEAVISALPKRRPRTMKMKPI